MRTPKADTDYKDIQMIILISVDCEERGNSNCYLDFSFILLVILNGIDLSKVKTIIDKTVQPVRFFFIHNLLTVIWN
jgi:hypothetical protein